MFDFIRVNRKMYMDLLEDLRQAKEANLRVTEDKFNVEQNIQGLRIEYEKKSREVNAIKGTAEDLRIRLHNLNEEIVRIKADFKEACEEAEEVSRIGVMEGRCPKDFFFIRYRVIRHPAHSPMPPEVEDGDDCILMIPDERLGAYYEFCTAQYPDEGVEEPYRFVTDDESGETWGEENEFYYIKLVRPEETPASEEKVPGLRKFGEWMESARKEAENEKTE